MKSKTVAMQLYCSLQLHPKMGLNGFGVGAEAVVVFLVCRKSWTCWRRVRQTSLWTRSSTQPALWTSNTTALPSHPAEEDVGAFTQYIYICTELFQAHKAGFISGCERIKTHCVFGCLHLSLPLTIQRCRVWWRRYRTREFVCSLSVRKDFKTASTCGATLQR